MNKNFLDVYKSLVSQSDKKRSLAMGGVWFAHGDEPLMSQWLVDGLRTIWQKDEQNIQRVELVSSKTWHEVLMALDSLSLFNSANAIIVTGNHKPDKATITALAGFASRVADNSQNSPSEVQNHLLWIAPKQKKQALSAKWIQPFSQSGLIIDCNLANERQRQNVLEHQACHFGLTLDMEAWQLLMLHTQNNLLNAYQTLWRLSYLFMGDSVPSAKTSINSEQLKFALESQSSYRSFDLSDAMLGKNIQQVVTILDVLKATNEPPTLVLWTIAKDMRLIQQLQSGKDAQSIGIWRNKQALYHQAQQRLSAQETSHWSELLLQCDQAIKGVIKQPVWELLLQSALSVAGVHFLSANR